MPAKLDRCVEKVKAKGGAKNAWAICRSQLGTDKEIKASSSKKGKK